MSSEKHGESRTDMEEMKEEEGGWVLVERDLPWETSKSVKVEKRKKLGHVEETSCKDSDQGQAWKPVRLSLIYFNFSSLFTIYKSFKLAVNRNSLLMSSLLPVMSIF